MRTAALPDECPLGKLIDIDRSIPPSGRRTWYTCLRNRTNWADVSAQKTSNGTQPRVLRNRRQPTNTPAATRSSLVPRNVTAPKNARPAELRCASIHCRTARSIVVISPSTTSEPYLTKRYARTRHPPARSRRIQSSRLRLSFTAFHTACVRRTGDIEIGRAHV